MSEKRNHSIDIARGFAILFVILGHMPATPELLKIWIFSFHIPLFFILSGMVTNFDKHPRFSSFLISRIRSLVIPYFSLNFILLLVSSVRDLLKARALPPSEVYANALIGIFIAYRRTLLYYSLWFVCSLFLSELAVFFIVKKLRSARLLCLVSIAAIFLQFFVFDYLKIDGSPWSIDTVPAGAAFLCVGQILRQNAAHLKKICSIRWLLPACAVSGLAAGINFHHHALTDLCMCNIGNPVYYFIAAISGSWVILIISDLLGRHPVLEYLGCRSIVIYAFQNAFGIPVSEDLAAFLSAHHRLFGDPVVIWLIEAITATAVCAVIAALICRFLPWAVGRKARPDAAVRTY